MMLAALAAASLAMLAPTVASAQKGNPSPGILPPTANAYGKSLTQWIGDYWRWFYTATDNTEPFQSGPMVFMPLPMGIYESGSWTPEDPAVLVGEYEVTLRPGTPFVLPAYAWVSERYQGYPTVPDDVVQPDSVVKGFITEQALTLDGKPILSNFLDYYVSGAFDPIAVYPQASSYGSVAAVYYQGVGFVAAPLPPGDHVLRLVETYIIEPGIFPGYSLGQIYDNTWLIHVVPPGKGK